MRKGLDRAASDGVVLESIGVDTWGCDYGLLDTRGELVGNPYHYRDARTDGVMEEVLARVSRTRIYDITGIQFLPFNTIYQLVAARHPQYSGDLAAFPANHTLGVDAGIGDEPAAQFALARGFS